MNSRRCIHYIYTISAFPLSRHRRIRREFFGTYYTCITLYIERRSYFFSSLKKSYSKPPKPHPRLNAGRLANGVFHAVISRCCRKSARRRRAQVRARLSVWLTQLGNNTAPTPGCSRWGGPTAAREWVKHVRHGLGFAQWLVYKRRIRTVFIHQFYRRTGPAHHCTNLHHEQGNVLLLVN